MGDVITNSSTITLKRHPGDRYRSTPGPTVPQFTQHDTFEAAALGNVYYPIYTNSAVSNDYAHSGTKSIKCTYPTTGNEGQTEQTGGNAAFPAGVMENSELWFRAWFYFPTSFSFAATPVSKLMRVENGNGYMGIAVYSDGTMVAANEENNSFYTNMDGTDPANTGFYDDVGTLTKGTWHAVEIYVLFHNTPGEGIFRIWHNGVLTMEDVLTETIKAPPYDTPGSFFFALWNDGAPQVQSAYVDDVIWTTVAPAGRDAAGNSFIGLS